MEITAINTATATPAATAALFERKPFAAALAFLASTIIEARNTIPIVSNVRIDACDEGARLSGTDLDLQASCVVSAAWDVPGSFTADARALAAAVKAADGDTVRLQVESGRVRVQGDTLASTVPTLPVDDFPTMIAVDRDKAATFALDALQLATDLQRVRFAVSTEETRYYLNGVALQVRSRGDDVPAVLKMAATDGHRLSLIERDAPTIEGAGMPDVIVPRKAIDALRKMMGKKPTGSAAFTVTATRAMIVVDGWTLESKMIDGTFPDYTRVIPLQNGTRAVVNAGQLAATADKIVKAIGNPRGGITCDWSDKGATLRGYCPDTGTAAASLAAEWHDYRKDRGNGGLEIGFNGRYLCDVAKAFPADADVSLWMQDAACPALLQGKGLPELTIVLMPMRVGGEPSTKVASKPARPAAVEPVQTPADVFRTAYAAAYVARDGDAIRAAIAAYRAAPGAWDAIAPGRVREQIALTCRNERVKLIEDRNSPAWHRERARLHRTYARDAAHYQGNRTRHGGGFRALTESIAAAARDAERLQAFTASLAAIPGFLDSDTRIVTPIEAKDGRRLFVIRRELRDPLCRYMTLVKACGTAPRRARSITRDQIARVIQPRGVKVRAAAPVAVAEPVATPAAAPTVDSTVVDALRADVAALQAIVAELQARPAVVTVATPYGPPAPAAAAPVKRERSAAERRAIIRAWRIRGELRAARAAAADFERIARAAETSVDINREAVLAERERGDQWRKAFALQLDKRPRTAARLAAMRRELRNARHAVTLADADRAELARLRPLAAAIAGLVAPTPAPVPAGVAGVIRIAA